MGALHAGHLSLVAAARAECDAVVASIFVNPSQFTPGEDYEAYPRDFEADCAKLEAAGVELVFAPTAEAMYPPGTSTSIEVAGIGDRLDGASRPGHFRGVATIVAKLFHIVEPDRAYFGQKDAAQVAVIRGMVRDLNMPVQVAVCPTVREGDGLAMSSRNRYLTREERGRALVLRRALDAAERLVQQGETRAERLRAAMLACFFDFAEPDDSKLRLDYAEVVDPETLEPVGDASRGALVAVAAWVGKTRLIDNFVIQARG
jgi:pantoate--beta-alanine ligase